MRKLLIIALFAVSGCGGGDDRPAEATPTPNATKDQAQALRDYYGDHPEDYTEGDVEAEYHQPPKPLVAGVGETITLTGTNVGVRMEVTVTSVERVDSWWAVNLRMQGTGIAVHDSPLENAALTYPGGKSEGVAKGAEASCSNGFDGVVRVDDITPARGCLLFGAEGSERPSRFQLALETVPVEVGGIWDLNAG